MIKLRGARPTMFPGPTMMNIFKKAITIDVRSDFDEPADLNYEIEDSDINDDSGYDSEYVDDYNDEPAEPTGLFSTPGRIIALVSSVVVLVFVAGAFVWLLGT